MRKLKAYDQNCFDFHKEVLASKNNTKKDPTYKGRVESLNEDITHQFDLYDSLFAINDLPLLTNKAFTVQCVEDLKKLYSYDLKAIQKLKIKVTTTEAGRVLNTCQNCAINQVNSFDHFVPQIDFPEFSVNPKNLFPSCTECNSKKSRIWKEDGKRKFLNLYLDELPTVQYLFVDIEFENGLPIAKFKVENINGINNETFELLKNHYDKLDLCNRYSSAIDETVTNTIISINEGLNSMSKDELRIVNLERQEKSKLAFGHNYWKAILQIELVNSDQFVSYAQSNPIG
jgi:hypothetical protein